MLYSYINLIDFYTLISTTTEDALYVKEYLYDNRPSRPFRFIAKANQDIVLDLSAAHLVTLAAIFNHNLTNAANVRIQGNAANAWGAPTFNQSLTWREMDVYKRISSNNRWWRFLIDDPTNSEYPEIGLAWLGNWNKFPNIHVQPGRSDSPLFFAREQETSFGQDWDVYLSESQTFELNLFNLNDPATIDDFHTFLRAISGCAGRFVFIPDERQPHVYFVKVVGNPSSQRLVYGINELRSWTLTLKVLTRGLTLL